MWKFYFIFFFTTSTTITTSNITYGSNLTATLQDTYSGVVAWQVTSTNTEPTTGWETITKSNIVTFN